MIEPEFYHYGVPGMKWGKRKAARVAAKTAKREARDEEDRQIMAARIRNDKRIANLQNKAAATYTATSAKGRKLAEEAYNKAEARMFSHPDAATSMRMTSGEKKIQRINTTVALSAIALTLGAGAIGALNS